MELQIGDIMTRKEEIRQAKENYLNTAFGKRIAHDTQTAEEAFIEGAEWADQNPNKKLVYTKQELYDMGFGFTINGDIINPYQDIKEIKQEVIDKACKYLESLTYQEFAGAPYERVFDGYDIQCFRKAMEE